MMTCGEAAAGAGRLPHSSRHVAPIGWVGGFPGAGKMNHVWPTFAAVIHIYVYVIENISGQTIDESIPIIPIIICVYICISDV